MNFRIPPEIGIDSRLRYLFGRKNPLNRFIQNKFTKMIGKVKSAAGS